MDHDDGDENQRIVTDAAEGGQILRRWGIDINSLPHFSEKETKITVGINIDYNPGFTLERRPTREQRRQLICALSAIPGYGGCEDASCAQTGIAWPGGADHAGDAIDPTSQRELRFYSEKPQFEDVDGMDSDEEEEQKRCEVVARGKYGLKLNEFIMIFYVMLKAGWNIVGYEGFDYDFSTHTLLGVLPRNYTFRHIRHDFRQPRRWEANFGNE